MLKAGGSLGNLRVHVGVGGRTSVTHSRPLTMMNVLRGIILIRSKEWISHYSCVNLLAYMTHQIAKVCCIGQQSYRPLRHQGTKHICASFFVADSVQVYPSTITCLLPVRTSSNGVFLSSTLKLTLPYYNLPTQPGS
jgi:hypothetical protein